MATKKRTGSITNRYKKQHGLHHKQSGKYLKVYWPYIPVLVMVIGGIFSSIYILINKPDTSISSNNISAPALLSETNKLRSNSKLSPLTINYQLSTAAQEKANDMAINNYWSPVSPSGTTPWQIIKSTGYQYQTAGENLAYGFSSSQSLFSAWENSNSHKQTILNSNFNNVGFGIAKAPNFQNQGPETIVVALYGSTTPGALPNSQSSQTFTSASITEPQSQAVVRAQSLTSSDSKVVFLIGGITMGAIACFLILRHGVILKKWLVEGEELVVSHLFLDIILVLMIFGLARLGQTVGFIR